MSAHRGWRAEASRGIAPPEGQHLLAGAGPEGNAVSDGSGLQRAQRARLVTVVIGLGQVGLAHLLDQHAPAREQLHEPGNDRLQQRVQFIVGGRTHLDEGWRAISAAQINPVQHEAVQVNVEVGGGPEALDQRDGATVAFVGLELSAVQQLAREHALHHLQHRGDQLGLRCQ